MVDSADDIVISLDSKRLIAIGLVAIVTVLSLTSYMVALTSFVSPSQEFRFKGETSDIWDQYYSITSSFNPGSTVIINGTLYSADRYLPYLYTFTGTVNVRWFVTVMDPNDLPIHFATDTISSLGLVNQTLPDVSFTIPSDAVNGVYTVRVMIWSGYLPSGDTLTFDVLQGTFTVPEVT